MNDRILPQMTGANGMNSVARRAGLYMAPDILLEAEHILDTQHPACLSHGPVMHILIARTEVTRIPTTLEFATSATKDKTWIGYQIGKWKKESEKRLMGVLSRNWWVMLSDSIISVQFFSVSIPFFCSTSNFWGYFSVSLIVPYLNHRSTCSL